MASIYGPRGLETADIRYYDAGQYGHDRIDMHERAELAELDCAVEWLNGHEGTTEP